MAKKSNSIKKVIHVRTHIRKVHISLKNPSGTTSVVEHLRNILSHDKVEIKRIFNSRKMEGIKYPQKNNLGFKTGNDYDELIAFWCDYYNKIFKEETPLNPNIIKALIASESSFVLNPPKNKIAIGIAQITKKTLKILQDSKGELNDHLFKDINQKDLLNPEISIPMAIRWLNYKKLRAKSKLGREPIAEEIILEYKGLLKSKSKLRDDVLVIFRKLYGKLVN